MTLPFSQQVTADATCRLLQAGSGLAANIAVTSVFTGQIWGAVAGTAGAIGMEALGRASGCYNNPDPAPGFEGELLYSGCKKFSSGYGRLNTYNRDDNTFKGTNATCKEVTNFEKIPSSGGFISRISILDKDGNPRTVQCNSDRYFQIDPEPGAVCGEPAPGTQYPDWQPDTPIGPAYEYTDPETGCTWSIVPMDVYLNSAGEPVFHWRAVSDDPVKCGDAYEWWGNGQEPNIPNFPDPGGPYGRPHPPSLPPGPGQDVKDELDKIKEMLEELKNCACPEESPGAKHWRSIRFESDEQTPNGNRRLTKLFRYRGTSPGVVDAVADHWKDFRWTTGPVYVKHEGSPLGNPQVWASTVDEGKRVIRHAGGEAGVDPDQIGKWRVSGSDNPRYGVSLEVGLFCVDGCWSATARPGPSGYPPASEVWPDSRVGIQKE